MRIRRFTAPDVSTAMGMIKRALGPEAVILARRDVATGSGGQAIELTAASDPDEEEEDRTQGIPEPARAAGSGPRPADRTAALVAELASEVSELRRALRQLAGKNRRRSIAKLGRQWADLYDRLCARGVLPNVAFDLVVRSALESKAGASAANEKLAAGIEEVLGAASGLGRVTFAIGPTGGGKTTTIAKLAARLAAGKRVGLVMADAFRLGATEQLGGYARLLGLPMEVATDGSELTRALARLADRDAILVDTGGQSGSEPELEALAEMIGAVAGPEKKVAWVVSATTETRALERAWLWFAGMRPEVCIATKVDEAGGLAQVYNWLWEARIPLSYLGTGQRVPDDLEPATGSLVGAWLLGGADVPLARTT